MGKHPGHTIRGGFKAPRVSRSGGAGGAGGMGPGPMGGDPLAGGAPSTQGSDALSPGETTSMPAPMPGQMGGASDPGAGSFTPPEPGDGSFRRGGRVC